MSDDGWSDEEMERGLDSLDSLRGAIVLTAVDWAGFIRVWDDKSADKSLDTLYELVNDYLNNIAYYGWINRR